MTSATRVRSWWCREGRHRGCPTYEQGVVCSCECHGTPETSAASGVWSFELPISKPLSLNDRSHWSKRASDVSDLREATGWLAHEAKIERCQKIKVTLIYEPRDKRRRDKDNLVATLKPVVDGLVDVDVIPDDTPEHVEYDMPLIDAPSGKQGRLVVLVERLL